MIYGLVIVIGLCLGSFLNVLISRWGNEEGALFGRSRCPRCRTQLAWYDLVPVLSFLILRGECRKCHKKISWQYPLVELAMASVLFLFVYQYGINLSLHEVFLGLLMLGFASLLFFDLVHFILPDGIIGPMIIGVGGHMAIWNAEQILSTAFTGLLACALFAILYIVSRGEWIGFGDVKLAFLIGLAFGYPFGVLIIIISIWAAAIVGASLILLRKATAKSAIPFGAFLAGVSIFYIIFFNEIQTFRWYF
jgi:leader peptidase (prepilin peptidase)/N-methyltransferase